MTRRHHTAAHRPGNTDLARAVSWRDGFHTNHAPHWLDAATIGAAVAAALLAVLIASAARPDTPLVRYGTVGFTQPASADQPGR